MKQARQVVLCLLIMMGYLPLSMNNIAHAEEAVVPQIAAGYYHSVGLISDGTVWSWGRGDRGQLGNGKTVSRAVPIQATGLSGVKSIAGGVRSSYAIMHDGTVMAWGANEKGQLGDGTLIDRTVPVQVTGLSNIEAISSGVGYHALALDAEGNVWAWGRNDYGDLGDGTTIGRTTPVQLDGVSDVKAIAAGGYFSLALKKDGTVWSWGWNDAGQLGNETEQQRPVPKQVPGLVRVEAIAAGGNHSLALDEDGNVWAWGENSFGAVGDGTSTNRTAPVRVSGLANVTAITGGGSHSLALDADGKVWAWGLNNYYQLGDGTTNWQYAPEQVPGLSGMQAIAAGGFHSFAMKSDGTVWSWGFNSNGELGDNTAISRSMPVKSRAVMDATAPSVSDGTITASSLTSSSVTLHWTKATDNMSEQGALQYLVYLSTEDDIRTVNGMETRGAPIGTYATDLEELAITELQPGTTYYFNVIVQDLVGYKSAYALQEITTKPIYTITYYGNDNTGGSVPVDSHSYEEGASVTVMGNSGNLVREGYRFAGWNTQADGNGTMYPVNASLIMGTADVQLYAMWALPGVPVLQPAVAGNESVTLTWSPAEGAIGYNIYQSESAGVYDAEAATVSGSVYSYDAVGLTNGTTYYFVVRALHPEGDSAASNEVSAIPATVPGAPENVSARAGDRQATIVFTAPEDDGGGDITGYEVTGLPGPVTATGIASPITVNGLSNGTAYTFTVKAVNGAGKSLASMVSNVVTPWPSSSDSDDSDTVEPEQPPEPTGPEKPDSGIDAVINGKAGNAGTATTTTVGRRTVTTVAVDAKKLEDRVAAAGQGAKITIPVKNAASDQVVVVEFDGRTIQYLAQHQAVVEIATEHATYTLPVGQIDMDSISSRLGSAAALQEIKVQFEIAGLTEEEMASVLEHGDKTGEFTLVAPPVSFAVRGTYGDSSIEISKFNTYVERTIAIPAGTDPDRITTGVVVEPDGTVRHVPTRIMLTDGKYYARISSLTNSTYALIWHPLVFKDAANHWAGNAMNDLGSRMIMSGVGQELFDPDRAMTRAEFAATIVRGLGLVSESGAIPFTDVKPSDWYCGAIQAAHAYKLISGFEDGAFRPTDKVTREQAMVILAQAMAVTGLKATSSSLAAGELLNAYTDADEISEWAKTGVADCLQAGIVFGTSGTTLAPKAYVTRAEVAVMIHRLLRKSDLI